MGRKRLVWILSCFADIRDWVLGTDVLCKWYRENNKLFEFQGRSNKAGIFVEIAVYFGGACRGCVIVPTSSNQSGWCLFSKELERFLSGPNMAWVKRTSDEDAGGGLTEVGGHRGNNSFKYCNQWKNRDFENTKAGSGKNVLKGTSGVSVTTRNGRPTRETLFKLNTANLAQRVSIADGGKRMVSWLNPKKSHKSNLSGLGFLNSASVQDKAHLPSPVSKAHKVDSYTGDLGVSIHRDQSVYVVGECSRPAMESSVVLVSPEPPTRDILPFPLHDQATEPIVHIPMASHPVCEGDSAAPIPAEESRHHGDHGFVGSGSIPSLGSQWVDSNQIGRAHV